MSQPNPTIEAMDATEDWWNSRSLDERQGIIYRLGLKDFDGLAKTPFVGLPEGVKADVIDYMVSL